MFKKMIVLMIKLIIACVVMIVLVKTVQTEKILVTLKKARLSFLTSALLFLAPNIYLQYYKWRYLLTLAKPQVTISEALSSLLVGFTFGFVTPGRIGEYGRAFFIKECHWVKILGLTFIDKLYNFIVVFLIGSVGILFILHRFCNPSIFVPILIPILVVVLLIVYIAFRPRFLSRLLYKVGIISPLREKIQTLVGLLDRFYSRQALTVFALACMFYVVTFIQFYLLILAFDSVSFETAFAAIPATFLTKSFLPISLGDLGIRESAAVFFFSRFEVGSATAFNASIALFSINVLLPSLVGLILILKKKPFSHD